MIRRFIKIYRIEKKIGHLKIHKIVMGNFSSVQYTHYELEGKTLSWSVSISDQNSFFMGYYGIST